MEAEIEAGQKAGERNEKGHVVVTSQSGTLSSQV